MTEKELLKIATSRPPLTDDEMSDDMGEDDINEICEEAWLRIQTLRKLDNFSLLESQND